MENNTLSHYGIRGMKWGIRRYQNKDGSLTPAGKKRYDNDPDNDQDPIPEKSSGSSRASSSSSASAKKSVKDMTDEELRAAVARLELEKRYRDLNPQKVSAGRQFLDKAIMPAATEAGKQLARDYITKVGKKALGLEDKKDADSYVTQLRKDVEKLDLEKRYRDLTKPNDELAESVNRLKNEVSKMTLTKQKERMEKEEKEENK